MITCNVVVVVYVPHSDKENSGQCNILNQFEATEDNEGTKQKILKTYNSNSFGFSF